MKSFIAAALLASVATFSPLHADTAAAPATSMVILTVEPTTLDKSLALKDIVKQLEAEREKIQKSLVADEKKLKKKDEELAAAQKKLSAADFEKERQKFETLVNDVRQKLEIKKIRMELAFEEAKKKVFAEFLKIVEGIRKEKNGVVFYANAVAAPPQNADISEKVLTEMDKALKTVKVTFKSDDEIKKMVSQAQGAQAQPAK